MGLVRLTSGRGSDSLGTSVSVRADNRTIDAKRLDALLVDLDGVVTDTASVHAAAWKSLFDSYLRERAERSGETFRPFDAKADYRAYVDGKPRYDGVQSFLESRGISLPRGSADDDPTRETVCGLGNRKNDLFRRILAENGVEVFEPTAAFLRRARASGVKLALVTSSKNGNLVLDSAGLSDLFEQRVDGVEIARLGLAGKPAPDTFLEAARRLGVAPGRAAVVEDAVSGIQAGRAGGFGLVIGIGTGSQAEALRRSGADVVVANLGEMTLAADTAPGQGSGVPLALESLREIGERIRGKRVAVFLDYDGTLTPIVDRPERAILSDEMRETIRRLANACTVAIVSGRDRADVQKLVAIDDLFYAGSHGFDIAGPAGRRMEHEEAARFAPVFDRAAGELHERIDGIDGALVERKKFAIAIHYRLAAEADVATIERAVDEVASAHRELRKTGGKKIFELRPRLDWHKGKAILWLQRALGVDGGDVASFYLGDDVTDEDAFATLRDRGTGILVAAEPQATRARYRLRDTDEVRVFLERLAAETEARRR
jgi:trehalose 6-phosphate phosphatase